MNKKIIGILFGGQSSEHEVSCMSAQTVTPILLGFLFDMTGAWRALPIYACIMTTLSAIVFISLVKNIKAKKVANVVGIEALDSGD